MFKNNIVASQYHCIPEASASEVATTACYREQSCLIIKSVLLTYKCIQIINLGVSNLSAFFSLFSISKKHVRR